MMMMMMMLIDCTVERHTTLSVVVDVVVDY